MSIFERMESLLEGLVVELVDSPNEVRVNGIEGDTTFVFEVSVMSDDVGKIIGKKGGTATAIRKIMNSIATKHRIRCIINFLEKKS